MFTNLASAIPGVGGAIGGTVGKVANLAGRALQTGIGVGKGIADGDWKGIMGGLASAAGGLGGLGGTLGKVAGEAGKAINLASGAGSAIEGAVRGDLSQVLGGLGGVAGGVGAMAAPGSNLAKVMDYAQKGLKLTDGIASGNLGNVADAAMGLAGDLAKNPALSGVAKNPVVQEVAKYAQKAVPFVQALANGDASQAMQAVATELGNIPGSPATKQALKLLGDGVRFTDALRTGQYGKALTGLSGSLQSLGAGPEAQTLARGVGQMGGVIEALGKGDPQALADALRGPDGRGGFLGALGDGALSKGFAGVADAAGKVLGSPELRTALDLTRAGTSFFSGLAQGDLNKALSGVAGLSAPLGKAVPQLSNLLSAGAPLVQSMARGDFGRALGALAENPAAAGFAEKLGLLDPLSDLANGHALAAMRGIEQELVRLRGVRERIAQLKDLETAGSELQERFQKDTLGTAQRLLRRSGYRKAPIQEPALAV
jgi:hypothetical protein